MSTIHSNLVLAKFEPTKFVVLVLSDGTTWMYCSPAFNKYGQEIYHKEIVEMFCRENGFTPIDCDRGVIRSARNGNYIGLRVEGGGKLETQKEGEGVRVNCYCRSLSYGPSRREVVEQWIHQAITKEGLKLGELTVLGGEE